MILTDSRSEWPNITLNWLFGFLHFTTFLQVFVSKISPPNLLTKHVTWLATLVLSISCIYKRFRAIMLRPYMHDACNVDGHAFMLNSNRLHFATFRFGLLPSEIVSSSAQTLLHRMATGCFSFVTWMVIQSECYEIDARCTKPSPWLV